MTTTMIDHWLHATRRYNPFTERESDGSVVIYWPINSRACFGLSLATVADLCDLDADLFAIVGSQVVLVVPQEIADFCENDVTDEKQPPRGWIDRAIKLLERPTA